MRICLAVLLVIGICGAGLDGAETVAPAGGAAATPVLHGDGVIDDAPAIQALLDSGVSCVALPVPVKHYAIGTTLVLHSGQTLRLEPTTVVRLLPGSSCTMVVNDPAEKDARDIRLIGGIWDMDNTNQSANPFHPEFAKDTEYPFRKYGGDAYRTDIFQKQYHLDTFLGCAIQFHDIRRLDIRDVTVRNPVTYGIQCCNLTYFTIENIRFDYEGERKHRINMDGVHLDGACRFGMIRNLQGTTYDDLLALNADDMASGPIESISIDGIFAKGALRAIRFLSAESRVNDISVSNVFGTYYSYPFEFSQYYATGKRGSFGRISIRNVYVSSCEHIEKQVPAWDKWPSIFRFDDTIDIEYLAIDNLHREESFKPTPLFWVYKNVHIGTLALSNVSMLNLTDGNMVFMELNGTIDRFSASNIMVTEKTPLAGSGKVGTLTKDDSCPWLQFVAK